MEGVCFEIWSLYFFCDLGLPAGFWFLMFCLPNLLLLPCSPGLEQVNDQQDNKPDGRKGVKVIVKKEVSLLETGKKSVK